MHLWIAVVGPTGVGKTWLAVQLAQHFPLEMVNADSRQTIRGLHAGTAAPTPQELHGVRSHLFGVRPADAAYTLHDWLGDARHAITAIEAAHHIPIIVGGTGLYVRALLHGFQLSKAPAEVRRRSSSTPDTLSQQVSELLARDPAAAARIDLHNPRRVVRALEALDAGVPASRPDIQTPHRPTLKIGIDMDAGSYREMIGERTAALLENGSLVAETRAALKAGLSAGALSASGIGYAEAIELIQSKISEEEMRDRMVHRTLRYAKAQRTWWRQEDGVHWLRRTRAGPESILPEAIRLVAEAVAPL